MSPGRVRRRTWTKRGPTGHQIKVTSWGFTAQVNGKQERKFNADWTKEDAQDALAKFLRDKDQRKAKPITLADAAERYEQAKARKRSLGEDKRTLRRLMAHFGRQTKLDKLTAEVISQYRDQRFAAGSKTLVHGSPSGGGAWPDLGASRPLSRCSSDGDDQVRTAP